MKKYNQVDRVWRSNPTSFESLIFKKSNILEPNTNIENGKAKIFERGAGETP